jgi:hypothetical protein
VFDSNQFSINNQRARLQRLALFFFPLDNLRQTKMGASESLLPFLQKDAKIFTKAVERRRIFWYNNLYNNFLL